MNHYLDIEYFNTHLYPTVDLIIKIVIGAIVVIYLHRRTYKDKLKEKLIDAFLEYLEKFKNFTKYELYLYKKEFYLKLLPIINENIIDEKMRTMLHERINSEIDIMEKDFTGNWYEINANFSPYTYKFCFLIGANFYFKHIQSLEDRFTEFLLDAKRYERTINDVIKEIDCKNKIKGISFSDVDNIISDINDSYSKIIYKKHSKDNMEYFNKYSNAIANKIDKM